MTEARGIALLSLASVLFASMAVLVRVLAGTVPSHQVVVVRCAVGLVAMLGWFAARRERPVMARPWLVALRGLFGGLAVTSYFYAIEKLGVGPATVLNYLAPCYAAVFAWAFLKERAGWATWLGLVLATGGGILVTASTVSLEVGAAPPWAAAVGLFAGVVGGAAMTVVKAVREDTDPATVFTSFNLVGILVALPFAAPAWVPIRPSGWGLLLAIGVLSIGGQLFYTFAMRFTSVARGSAVTQLVPVLAWATGTVLLGEVPKPLGWAGAALGIGGVLLGVIRVGGRGTAMFLEQAKASKAG